MKVKKDFVTNSSSTSFIVIDKTTGEVLRGMIEVLRQEDRTDFRRSKKVAVFLKVLENMKFDENINFPFTINEETFIYRVCPAKVRVDTSFNHDWQRLPFKTESCKEFDEVWERSKEMPFIDLKDFEVKSRKQIEFERMEEFDREHQEFLKRQEEEKKNENKRRLRNQ